jgi:hypothetical protein
MPRSLGRLKKTFLNLVHFLVLTAFTFLSNQSVSAYQFPLQYQEITQDEIKFRIYRSKYDTIIQIIGPSVCKDGNCPTYMCTHNENESCLNSKLFMAGTFVFSDDVLSKGNLTSIIFCNDLSRKICTRRKISLNGIYLDRKYMDKNNANK